MKPFQKAFLELCLQLNVLRFGQFTLKSGRESPYFFNAGLFDSGMALKRLGEYYAAAVLDAGLDFNLIYGPAYKGIPLAAAISIAFAEKHGRDIAYCYNRKEAKDHGEGGHLVGAPLKGRVLVVDDVISAGTSIRESAEIIDQAGADFVGVAVALDRQERGLTDRAASAEIANKYQVDMISIIDLHTLIEYLGQRKDMEPTRKQVIQYRAVYGPSH